MVKFMLDFIISFFLGIVEGITEWLPISSTGHLILFNEFLRVGEYSFWNSQIFLYVIQLGAILAVVTLYFKKLNPFSPSKTAKQKADTWQMWFKVVIGCVPAGVFGVLLNDFMDSISNYIVVSAMLILYGAAFIFIENKNRGRAKITDMNGLTYKTAFLIGLFQVLSIIPGTSRSGATILGAIILGCSREIAAEFSFFMAIPIMFGVSLIKIVTNDYVMTSHEWLLLAVSAVTAYLVSIAALKLLVSYVKRHDFKIFGIYRIILGVIVLLYFTLLH